MSSIVFDFVDIQTVLVFVAILLGIYLYMSTWLPKNFPPGPMRLPIIGSMTALGADPDKDHIARTELSKKYGPVVGLKIGSYPTVLLNSLESIKEALVTNGDVWYNRPHQLYCISRMSTPGGQGPIRGLFWTNGDKWKHSRRAVLSSMKEFGMGRRNIEDKIQEEAIIMCGELSKVAGQSFDVEVLFQQAVSNIICIFCFGTRYEYTDATFNKLMQMLQCIFKSDALGSVEDMVPLLRMLPESEKMCRLMSNVTGMERLIQIQFERHREVFDPKEIRNFIDFYFFNETKHNVALCPEDMKRIILDLFLVGTDTVSTALRWTVLFLILHPDIQKKCQQELDEVVGSHRQPSLSDRQRMPYMEGFIHEGLRIGNVTTDTFPHSTENDTILCGYNIPKDTMILPNLYACHMNSKYFKNPEEFTPERWIGPDGKFQKNEAFVAFGMGPRMCPGETLAWNELFLFLSFMLQRFNFRAADPDNPPSQEGKMGITHSPKQFDIKVESRS